MERRLAAILAADVSGYSRLVGLDETDTFRRLKALRAEVLEPLVAGHDGHIVDYSGDGVLADFPSLVRAVEIGVAQVSTPGIHATHVCRLTLQKPNNKAQRL